MHLLPRRLASKPEAFRVNLRPQTPRACLGAASPPWVSGRTQTRKQVVMCPAAQTKQPSEGPPEAKHRRGSSLVKGRIIPVVSSEMAFDPHSGAGVSVLPAPRELLMVQTRRELALSCRIVGAGGGVLRAFRDATRWFVPRVTGIISARPTEGN